MGCAPSKTVETIDDPLFRGVSSRDRARYRAYLAYMDNVRRLPHLTHPSLLLGMARRGVWTVYLHFSDWPVPVSATIVKALLAQMQSACTAWTKYVAGFEGFPKQKVRVKLFGIVLREGVKTTKSFDRTYEAYPVVRNWKEDDEHSPWLIAHKGKALPAKPNLYAANIDLSELTVVGNRSGTGASFSPESWKGYRHPEGCTGFETKYWHGSRWNAVAQRHYLRVGGAIEDPHTGKFGVRGDTVLRHEMGHCFFLDDLYDDKKYPRLLDGVHKLEPTDSIMFHAGRLTSFDGVMLRHTWRVQKKRFATSTKTEL